MDGNENFVVLLIILILSLVDYGILFLDNMLRNYFSKFSFSLLLLGYLYDYMNGYISFMLSFIDLVFNNLYLWFVLIMVLLLFIISNMIGGLVILLMNFFMNRLIIYLSNLLFFFGFGLLVIMFFMYNNVSGGYVINYFGFLFSLDGYVGGMSIGNSIINLLYGVICYCC